MNLSSTKKSPPFKHVVSMSGLCLLHALLIRFDYPIIMTSFFVILKILVQWFLLDEIKMEISIMPYDLTN